MVFTGWDNTVEVLRSEELEGSVDEISKIIEKDAVIGSDELIPGELGIRRLWPMGEQIVSPDIRRYTSILGRIAKNADATGFGELVILICQKFCG